MAQLPQFDLAELKRRMQTAHASLKHELGGLRTGRASISLLEPVHVEAYGQRMPLNQVATISVPEPRALSVSVWDKSMVHAVDKAIRDSNLGLSPTVEGTMLRIRIPELNEQRRKEMVKIAHKYTEDARVAVRHVRREGFDVLKKLLKEHAISEDDEKQHETEVQKATDEAISEIDASLNAKERKSCRSRRSYPLSEAPACPIRAPIRSPATLRRRRMSPSSWTATAAGRRRAACRASRATGAASRRCAGRSARRSNTASRYLTLYSFSSENWKRPPDEVAMLMGLLKRFIRNDLAELNEHGVRVRIIGEREGLAPDIVSLLDEAESLTRDNRGLTLTVAFNYGARQEIVAAARRLAIEVREGRLDPGSIGPDEFAAALDTAELPDPDLIIRTSGEMRLSNFLLWQCAYAELVFLPLLWPDFDDAAFVQALDQYAARERRFGALAEPAAVMSAS